MMRKCQKHSIPYIQRAQELYFDRLFFQDIISASYDSKIVKSSEQTSPQSLRLTLHKNLKWHKMSGEAWMQFSTRNLLQHWHTNFVPICKSCTVKSKMGSHKTKTQVEVAGGSIDPVAEGDTREPRIVVPATTPVDTIGA